DHGRRDANAATRRADRLRNPVRKALAAARAEPRPHRRPGDRQLAGVDAAGLLDLSLRPELLEVGRVAGGELRRVDDEDDVLLARPRVGGPVRRARPDAGAVP